MRLMLFIMSLCLLVVATGARAEPYKLQPGDTLEVWVAQDERMNREAIISPDGTLSLPLVGQIEAQDLTVDQLEQELSQKLAGFFKGELNLSVMLQPGAQHMPMIYVVGDVDAPGSFPYRPTMTVLHAVTVAGGLYRTPMEARDQDRALVVENQLAETRRRIADTTLRIARLNAELAGRQDIELPAGALPEMSETERQNLVERERQVLKANIDEVNAQRNAQTQLSTLGDSGIEALRRRMESVNRRIDLANQRLASTSALVAKGLSHASAKLELEAEVAELREQGDELQNDLSALEGANLTEKTRVDTYLNERQARLLAELHDNERQLQSAKAALIQDERVMSIYTNSEISERRGIEAHYSIMRSQDGDVSEVPATETTLLRPGDLVRVAYQRNGQRSASIDGTQAGGSN